jgi:WD40 repeat protein
MLALTGALDGSVLLWRCDTGEIVRSLKGHERWICATQLTTDGRYALTTAPEGAILWDLETGERLRSFDAADQNRLIGTCLVVMDAESSALRSEQESSFGMLDRGCWSDGFLKGHFPRPASSTRSASD